MDFVNGFVKAFNRRSTLFLLTPFTASIHAFPSTMNF